MKKLYARLENNYYDRDFRCNATIGDSIALAEAILNSTFSRETKDTLLFQFYSNLITIKVLAYKLLNEQPNVK